MKRLFLIDGHALIFKMYYAFLGRPMVNSKGVDTSILFGFTKYILELIEKEKPTHFAVSFDPPGGTFRNKLYPEYKANRGETPQLVIDALEPLTRIVKAMGIPVLMEMGFEADDVIGSMAKRSAREGFEVFMVTPDKDYGQLVEPCIHQYRPGKSGADNEILGEAEVCAKWGINSTSQVIDILALCGDSSDNVPGVAGIGPVSASKLLLKYGSVEEIYSHLDELTSSQKAKFEAAADHIALSKELVTIKTDIPLLETGENMELNVSLTSGLLGIFDEFEFPSLKRKLFSLFGRKAEEEPIDIFDLSGNGEAGPEEAGCGKPEEAAAEVPEVVFPENAVAVRISRSESDGLFGGGDVEVAVNDNNGTRKGSAAEMKSILEDPSILKIGESLKDQMHILAEEGVKLEGPIEDIALMRYVLNPEEKASGEPASPEELKALAKSLKSELAKEPKLLKIYEEIELPLLRVLFRMESDGVKIDINSLKDFAGGLRVEMLEKEAQVREIAGIPTLNVSSPKQLGEVIFERLNLDPGAKKPKSGSWPTDEQTLSELSDRSPIIGAILEYRALRKLLSTYIEPLPDFIREDGRVHTTFNQTLTATGRLSSSNPNLQNIPVRTERGRVLRKAFVPQEQDWVIMSADYSQIELRIMAELSADEHLRTAFRCGVDVHAATAAKIFHKEVADVTPDERRIAKTANFGIMYGISSFGLSQRLECSRAEAKQIIDDYFESFPSIRGFIDSTLSAARANGYVETIFGRRRYTPDVVSPNGNIRSIAERNAVNAPIQGSSADIIKLAMIGVDRRLREEGLLSRMVLQIHDELVLEVPAPEIDRVKEILTSEMENVVSLSIPLTVECNYGKTWLEAH